MFVNIPTNPDTLNDFSAPPDTNESNISIEQMMNLPNEDKPTNESTSESSESSSRDKTEAEQHPTSERRNSENDTPESSFDPFEQHDEGLAKAIPNFYRLLDLRKDDGSDGLGIFTYPKHFYVIRYYGKY